MVSKLGIPRFIQSLLKEPAPFSVSELIAPLQSRYGLPPYLRAIRSLLPVPSYLLTLPHFQTYSLTDL